MKRNTNREPITDVFWIEPVTIDGRTALIRACFNEFSVIISVERKDGTAIEKVDAERAYTSIIAKLPLDIPS